MILDFLLVLARKLWLNYLIWNNPTKRGGRSSSQKLFKKKQTNKQTKQKQKQNQTIILPYWFIVFRKKKNNKRYWIAINHLSWHSLNLQMLQKWLEENMEMHVAQKSQEKYWQSSCVFLFRHTIIRTRAKMSDVLHNHYTLLTLVPPGRGVGLDLPVPVRRVSPLLPIQQAPQQSSPLFPEVKINELQLKDKKLQSSLWRT